MNRPRLALFLIVMGATACHFGPPHHVPDDAGTDDEGTPDGNDDVGTPDDSGQADARPEADAGEAGDADQQG
jgi:hypothetical protein